MEKRKLFYGWIIVAAGCVIMATTMGVMSNCNSLFIRPISEDLGLSRQAVSTMLSVMSLGSMAASFFAGKIFNETNIIRIMRVSIIVMSAAYFANSLAQDIRFLYLTHLINGIGMCLVTTLPITFLLNNWFTDKVGYALGLASMGSGIGGALFNTIAGQLIASVGWRSTYRILTLFVIVLSVPCVFFLLKLKPEEMGLEPYTDPSLHRTDEPKEENTGYSFAEARRLPVFWILCVMCIVIGTCMNGMYTSVSPYLQDSGYSITFSANFLSVCMLALAVGKILLGKIFDRSGVRIAFCWACLCVSLACAGLLLCKSFLPSLVLTVLGIAFGCIFGAVVFPLSIPLIFGKKDYRAIMGPYAALISLGGVFGPTIAGKIYDVFGSYSLFYIADAVIMLGVVVLMYRVLPAKDRQFR